MFDRQATIQDKAKKIDFLNKMLNGEYKEKFKALDTIVEASTQYGGKNDPIKIDYEKINELKEEYTINVVNEDVYEAPIVAPKQKYVPRPLGSSRALPSVSTDQMSALLGGNLNEARALKASTPSRQQSSAPAKVSSPQPKQQLFESDVVQAKKQLKEELIYELVNDKDVRTEIMETILYELFGKDRMKKLLKEILAEAKQNKK